MDFSHHLSEEAKRRAPSLAKSLYPIMLIPDLKSLGGGLPDAKLFPLTHVEYDIPLPPENAEAAKNIQRTKLELFHGISSQGQSSALDLALAQQYIAGSGYPELISILKSLTTLMHRPPVQADHRIGCTLGNADGISKIQRTLLNPGENSQYLLLETRHSATLRPFTVLFEEFSFSLPVENCRAMGVGLVPVPMDAEGANPEAYAFDHDILTFHTDGYCRSLDKIMTEWDAAKAGPKPHVFYMVTIGQNPTTSTGSLERLKAIYAIAQKHDIIILEDDPYFFLQLGKYVPNKQRETHSDKTETPSMDIGGEPEQQFSMEGFVHSFARTMLSIDTEGRVVRFDSFSKIVFPGSRMGWVTANPLFLERMERLSEVTTSNGNGINQAFFTQLLTSPSEKSNNGWGFEGFAKWVNHVRRTYAKKRDLFLDTLNREVPPELEILSGVAPEAGMFVWMRVNIEKHPLFKRDDNATPKTNTAELMEDLFQLFIANGCLVLTARFFSVQHTLPAGFQGTGEPIFEDMRDKEGCLRATFAGDPAVMVEAIKRMAKVLKSVFKVEEAAPQPKTNGVNGSVER